MEPIKSHPHGAFSWTDLNTTDAAGAKAFYSGLFGWDFEDQPTGTGPDYTMFSLEGHNVAGMTPMNAEQQAQGVPPYWVSYITVDDLEATAGRVEALGGQLALPPFDVLDAGRMALLIDPTGAMVALWHPGRHIGAELRDVPGALTWNELSTGDPTAAKAFYGALLGWDWQEMAMGSGPYHVLKAGGVDYGGIMNILPGMEGMPPNWGVYFLVPDVEAACQKVEALGGKVLAPTFFAEGVGHMAVVQDPQGGAFSVITYVEREA